jgi:hypothetical protein
VLISNELLVIYMFCWGDENFVFEYIRMNYFCMKNINDDFMFVQLDDSIKDEIIANQRMVPPGKSLMALNGALINIEDLDLYLYVTLYFRDNNVSDYLICFPTFISQVN